MDYRDFTGFTLQERRGIAVFLILAAFIICGSRWYTRHIKIPPDDVSMYYITQDSFHHMTVKEFEYVMDIKATSNTKKDWSLNYIFSFDPNTISEDSMRMLGMSQKAARNLIRYRSKGGKIKHLRQLKSIYGMDSSWVNAVSDSIQLPRDQSRFTEKKSLRKDSTAGYFAKNTDPLDLNSADSLQLLAVKGIGPYFAHKILDYRRKLGGYLHTSQLLEISRINDSIYQQLEKYFYVDTTKIQRMDINTADFKTFIRHPYFNKDVTQKILRYRKQNGPFEKAEHISRIRHLKESEGQKILPYLSPQ